MGTPRSPSPIGVRNPGLPLDLDWVHEARFTNRSATERRAATLPARRSVKKAWQGGLAAARDYRAST